MTWTDPEIEPTICPAGESVVIIKQANVQKNNTGVELARVEYRTLRCSKAPGDVRVGLRDRQPWMCEDCNLVDQ